MSHCPECGGTMNGYTLCDECDAPNEQQRQQFRAAAKELAEHITSQHSVNLPCYCDACDLARRVLELDPTKGTSKD